MKKRIHSRSKEVKNVKKKKKVRRIPELQSKALVQLASRCEFFHTPGDRTGYASIPSGTHQETHRIDSSTFKEWLQRKYFRKNGKPPSNQTLNDAIGVLKAKAKFDGEQHEVFIRVGELEEAVHIDLGDEQWRSVKITENGRSVLKRSSVKFRRAPGMLPLPRPERGGNIDDLKQLLNLKESSDFKLIVGWLLAALRPQGPYPVLALYGEQGSGKSTMSRILRMLIDPNLAPIRSTPSNERDLIISALNSWILSFDNLSRIPNWLSDSLCRLSTGGGFSTRKLYADSEETLFQVQRPVILNGIEEIIIRADLLDRSLLIQLPSIADRERFLEGSLWKEFEEVRPRILGALLDAVSEALANYEDTTPPRLPRMADMAKWVTAAAPALGWRKKDFLNAYENNRIQATEIALAASPVGSAIRELVEYDNWEGTPTELLEALNECADENIIRQRGWPKAAHSLSGKLTRLIPSLRKVGIKIDQTSRGSGYSKERWVVIRNTSVI
ncbi:hypothetical protein ACFLQ0_00320 [Nitrospinota bacterium]